MDIKDMQIIRQIYETGSVTKTATAMFISPQALSKRIQRIENELDTILFERTPSGMVPTDACKRFYEQSEELYNNMTDFVESFRSHSVMNPARLTVASSLGILALITPDKIREFRNQNPDIDLQIKEYPDKNVDRLVRDGSADIGLAIAPVSPDDFSSVPITQIPFCILTGKDSYLTGKSVIRFEDLRDVPLALENRDFKVFDIINSSCRSKGIIPDIYCETLELELAHSLARENKCAAVSVLSERFLHRYSDLKVKKFRNQIFWQILAIKKSGETFNSYETRFLDFIESELSEVS